MKSVCYCFSENILKGVNEKNNMFITGGQYDRKHGIC